MLIRTHLAITLFAVLALLSGVSHKISFVVVAFIATFIPDIDSPNSKAGNHLFLRPLQWVAGHRKVFHSFSFLILVTLFLVLFFPIIALGFFLGYGLHLLADCFTKEGIMPFYPFKSKSSGMVSTGGVVETGILVFFVLADLFLLVLKVAHAF